jgi:molybdate transport system ATP-binding protein
VLEADVEVDRREFGVAAALQVAPGERLALFGPSGSGKTTILEMIAGLVPPRRGQVVLTGRLLTQTWAPRVAVPAWQRRVGLLRQDPALFPHLTVRQNLEYGAGPRPDPTQTAQLAAELGIRGLLGDRPARLSGGQAHRVALGRLLLAHCDALLLDEPYSGLDAELRRLLTGLVRSLAAERGVPTVLVAHELADAQAFADRLAVLDRGRLLQTGPAGEVVRRPASRRVAELVGYRAFVPLTGDPGESAQPAVTPGEAGAVPRRDAGAVTPGEAGAVLAGEAGVVGPVSPEEAGEVVPGGTGLVGPVSPGEVGAQVRSGVGTGSLPGVAGTGDWPGVAGSGARPGVVGAGVRADGVVGAAQAGVDSAAVQAGLVAGVHPERVVAGAHPERGLVLAGLARTCHPAGAGWEAEILVGSASVWCRLPDPPSGDVTVTVLDPPCFGPDGTLLPRAERVRA